MLAVVMKDCSNDKIYLESWDSMYGASAYYSNIYDPASNSNQILTPYAVRMYTDYTKV